MWFPAATGPMRAGTLPRGSRQASWLGAHVRVVEADGTTRKKPDGSPEIRTILFPVTSATMYDVWDVIGLKGTGTDSYSVDNLFIPEKFAVLRDVSSAVREKGPLYSSPPTPCSGWVCRDLARRRPRHAGRRGRAGPRQGIARAEGDAREQRGSGPDRPHGRRACAPPAPISILPRPKSGATSPRGESHHRRSIASRCASPRPGPSISRPRSSMPPITWPAPPLYSPPTRSSGASATCTRSRSRSSPATPTMKMPGG